jgi:hypothetical protein
MATDTKQTELKRDAKGRITGGTPPAGFNVHPENRNDGRWNKEESISYQYNLLGRMSDEELQAFVPKNQFQQIALTRIKSAKNNKFGLADTKEITDRTEGKAPQSIDVTTGGDKLNVSLVEFVDGNNKDQSTDT